MKQEKIIKLYHENLINELGCTPIFKIGDRCRVRNYNKDFGGYIYHEVKEDKKTMLHGSNGRAWIVWDSTRVELEGKEGVIVYIDYTNDDDSYDKSGCLGYMVKFGNRRVALHEECLIKIRDKKVKNITKIRDSKVENGNIQGKNLGMKR